MTLNGAKYATIAGIVAIISENIILVFWNHDFRIGFYSVVIIVLKGKVSMMIKVLSENMKLILLVAILRIKAFMV